MDVQATLIGAVAISFAALGAPPALAGHFFACDSKACPTEGTAADCGREIRWLVSEANLQFRWDVDGHFIALERQVRVPVPGSGASNRTQATATMAEGVERSFNTDVNSKEFRASLVAAFDKNASAAPRIADAIARRIGSICAKSEGTLLGIGVIVASNKTELARQGMIAGILHFCDPQVSINYAKSIDQTVWAKLKATVHGVADFDTMRNQADGHHANKVSLSMDENAGPKQAAVRLSVEPYVEFQFKDRLSEDFDSKVRSECEREDAAAVDMIKRFGRIP